MVRAIDFFKLFFTDILMRQICLHTNSYGWMKIVDKPYYGDNAGAWKETTEEEIALLIAIILYFGLVKVSSFHRYWSTNDPLSRSLGLINHEKRQIQSTDGNATCCPPKQ